MTRTRFSQGVPLTKKSWVNGRVWTEVSVVFGRPLPDTLIRSLVCPINGPKPMCLVVGDENSTNRTGYGSRPLFHPSLSDYRRVGGTRSSLLGHLRVSVRRIRVDSGRGVFIRDSRVYIRPDHRSSFVPQNLFTVTNVTLVQSGIVN